MAEARRPPNEVAGEREQSYAAILGSNPDGGDDPDADASRVKHVDVAAIASLELRRALWLKLTEVQSRR